MVEIAPALFPHLYQLFITTTQYSNKTRAMAVVIFTTCTNVIIELSQIEKVKHLMNDIIDLSYTLRTIMDVKIDIPRKLV